ncbi:MAG: hypothetical protein KGZ40_01235 [Clostridiales bacterium]|nr:hypothetical protein [Clostridiales bacterium]
MKRLSVVTVLGLAMLFAYSAVAFANFGPHGGYSKDTDACAGCHRAHTSFSDLTWTDDTVARAEHSALLISNATTMSEFCNVCHGDNAPGASTNVVSGVFDGGPSGPQNGGEFRWDTNSVWNATLNGGGFESMPDPANPGDFMAITSSHRMDVVAAQMYPAWGQYGAGNALPAATSLTCTSCHDVHGSSNYRLLKDYVNGQVVGGYIDDYTPTPFVVSAEQGYPAVGWKKHEVGAAQMADYRPNYTSPEYATTNNDAEKGISGWCASCHQAYVVRNDAAAGLTYNYGDFLPSTETTKVGAETFHRHPVNVSLAAGDPAGYALGVSWLRSAVVTDTLIPLEARAGSDHAAFRAGNWGYDDFMGCLTCHRAHGSTARMTGYASAELKWEVGGSLIPVPYEASSAATAGVDPTFTSALLRTDDRGVCQRCHNK